MLGGDACIIALPSVDEFGLCDLGHSKSANHSTKLCAIHVLI